MTLHKTAAIFHGLGGYQERFWVPWQKAFLEAKGFKVWTPSLPNQQNLNNIDRWINEITAKSPYDHFDLIVSHSTGNEFIQKLLLQNHFSVNHVVSIAGFINPSSDMQQPCIPQTNLQSSMQQRNHR